MALRSRRNEMIVLAVLVVVLGLAAWYSRSQAPSFAGVFTSNQPFKPLNVEDPTLRRDLLERIQKLEYAGTHRNIFSAEPPPPPVPQGGTKPTSLTPLETGPPPLEVPATFFGYATNPLTGKRQAFLTNGDDVYVVEEGGTLLNRFKVVKIGNNTLDLQEISSGRRTTLTMELPPQQ